MSGLILGVSAYHRDSAAVLLRDGEIVAAAQEESFTRTLHDAGFPTRAIAYCLQEAQVALADIDCVVLYSGAVLNIAPWLDAPRGVSSLLRALPQWLPETLPLKILLKQQLAAIGSMPGKVLIADGQKAAAAAAFFPSPFQRAAVLNVNRVGDAIVCSLWRGEGNTLTLWRETEMPVSSQARVETLAMEIVRAAYRELKLDNLCVAGDGAVTVGVDWSRLRAGSFHNIWMQSVNGDAGAALGAALTIWHEQLGLNRKAPIAKGLRGDVLRGGYLGPWFASDSIAEYLDSIGAPYTKLDDVDFSAALSTVLAAGKLVGWFQGRMQFGSNGRAARAIIGAARSAAMMSASSIPVAAADIHPRLSSVLDAFAAKTGRRDLASLSFNVPDEPVVCTPADAYRCFMRSEIDCLALENLVLHKREQPLWDEE